MKNSNIYDKNGYLNYDVIMKDKMVYKFIVGGRGIGKTFGALKYAIDNQLKFIFMRRTQSQIDLIKNDELNPFNALGSVLGNKYEFVMKKINRNITGVYHAEFDSEQQMYVASGELIGYLMALSTISNIRGFDASDVDILIFDEFIGEKHEKPIQSEGTAFLNAIETIARNREFNNGKPLDVLCLSNSNDLANPIFIETRMVILVEKMLKKNIFEASYPDRALSIYLIDKSPISKVKENTSLYKLAGKSEFTKMSLNNEFTNDNMDMIKSQKFIEYKPLVKVGEICIYRHKAKRLWYISEHSNGVFKDIYGSSEVELKRFVNDFYFLKLAYMNKHIYFESYILQILFEKYIKI